MRYPEFIDSLARDACPAGLDPCLQALWYDTTGEWDMAHEIVQAINSTLAARIHAYLHRKAGTGMPGRCFPTASAWRRSGMRWYMS